MLTHELTVVEPGRIEVTKTDLDDHLHPHEVLEVVPKLASGRIKGRQVSLL